MSFFSQLFGMCCGASNDHHDKLPQSESDADALVKPSMVVNPQKIERPFRWPALGSGCLTFPPSEGQRSSLHTGVAMFSKNEKFYVVAQPDGNLVIYDFDVHHTFGGLGAMQSTGTKHDDQTTRHVTHFEVRGDGSLALVCDGRVVWLRGADARVRNTATVRLSDRGRLELYTADNEGEIWLGEVDLGRNEVGRMVE